MLARKNLLLALKWFKALRSRSCSNVSRPCALAQNVLRKLSASQFCAHFEILNHCQSSQRQRFFASRHAFWNKISISYWGLQVYLCLKIDENGFILSAKRALICARAQRSQVRIWVALTKALPIINAFPLYMDERWARWCSVRSLY